MSDWLPNFMNEPDGDSWLPQVVGRSHGLAYLPDRINAHRQNRQAQNGGRPKGQKDVNKGARRTSGR